MSKTGQLLYVLANLLCCEQLNTVRRELVLKVTWPQSCTTATDNS